LDSFCRDTDGQCNCRENAYGRRCNECQPGFWNFPDCQPCECNRHAQTCEAETGECIECNEWTDGFHCEICLDGYFGDPRLEVGIQGRDSPMFKNYYSLRF
jgi:laminin beta 1